METPDFPEVGRSSSPDHSEMLPADVSGQEPNFVVGIGASAGGLEALEALFHRMPTDTGMAFIVVQHLSPDFKSLMSELLSRHTEMPIYRVRDGMKVEANAVYLIPPKKEMLISGGVFLLTDKDPQQSLALPIDVFFRSMAQDVKDRAVGIGPLGHGQRRFARSARHPRSGRTRSGSRRALGQIRRHAAIGPRHRCGGPRPPPGGHA